MGKYVTITEIALQLGISHSTVSRALNDNPRISEKTKEKVRRLAEELGYFSNSMANLLSKGQSKIVGVIVPDITINFFAKVIKGIQDTLQKEGYSIFLFNTGESLEKEKEAINTCLKHRVDGVLAAISIQTQKFNHFEKLLKYEVPLVFYDRVANFLPVPKIIANDYRAAYNATKYLIDLGCKCIAHITGSINLNNSNNRLYGYIDALTDHEIEVDETLIFYYEFQANTIETFLQKIIQSNPHLDGLFVFNDYAANYAINVLTKMGKKIPEDISVFGFSDEPVATYMTPQLSTVKQIATKMGQLAAEKMLSVLNRNESLLNEKIIIDPELIIRETTRKM
ncbi:LacI family DNA-binding transcriptional regulator [Flexithrix dorotheae]|uniref:LacI family DNA-binding transcriptional regulator n=1 Tax=Flexithrix dorotheae TaxID=70993 RepID=UPI00037C711A|nr:LacI family DNA-binding transcriptional regulator [Flexithrix dorotheae]